MTLSSQLTATEIRPAEMMENAQHNLASWSRACTQVVHGLMSAGIAQMELTKSLYVMSPQDWTGLTEVTNPREIARRWVQGTKSRRDATVQDWRKIQDDFAATLFTAAESLLDGQAAGPGGSRGENRASD